MKTKKYADEYKTFEDDEFRAILEYVGLSNDQLKLPLTSVDDKKLGTEEELFTKEDLYMYLHGKGSGSINNLRTKVRLTSMNIQQDKDFRKVLVPEEQVSNSSGENSDLEHFSLDGEQT